MNEYADCKIVDIHRGSAKANRQHIIYAKLVDAQGNLLIAATLEYILNELKQRLP